VDGPRQQQAGGRAGAWRGAGLRGAAQEPSPGLLELIFVFLQPQPSLLHLLLLRLLGLLDALDADAVGGHVLLLLLLLFLLLWLFLLAFILLALRLGFWFFLGWFFPDLFDGDQSVEGESELLTHLLALLEAVGEEGVLEFVLRGAGSTSSGCHSMAVMTNPSRVRILSTSSPKLSGFSTRMSTS
jgi:hypothetical protein